MTLPEFDALYWASKDPQLKAITDIPPVLGSDDPYSNRKTQALVLATQGLVVDNAIMVWGWDPFLVMTLRTQDFNIPYVSSVLGVAAIKSSLDPADYPPFNPAPVLIPPAVTSLVGPSQGFGPDGKGGFIEYFGTTISDASHSPLTDGQLYTRDPRGNFIYHIKSYIGGTFSQWFTKA